jgi:O-acetylserine/cysteine efflux transporter
VVLRERPSARRASGPAVSALGLVLVGVTRGGAIPLAALLPVLGAGASWAIGNVLIRVAPFTERRADNGFRLVVWSALVPPLPLFALSLIESVPGRGRAVHADWAALSAAGPRARLALGYMVVLGTIAAMSIWSSLLARYPADRVTPFALGIPVLALLLSRILMHESLGVATLGACAVVPAGLALVALPEHAAAVGDAAPEAEPATAGRARPWAWDSRIPRHDAPQPRPVRSVRSA